MQQPTYAISGDTTEWDDILIKHGVTTKDEVLEKKGLNPRDYDKKKEAQWSAT
jgi:phage portal protein BeeE